MDQRGKQRLVGAVVLVALAVIFIPMLLTGPVEREVTDVPIEIPPQPVIDAPSLPAPGVGPDAIEELVTSSRPIESPQQQPEARAPQSAPAERAPAERQPAPVAETKPPVIAPDEPDQKSSAATAPELASWAVQVGSFGSEANAMRLRDQLRQKGYQAYVDSIQGKTRVLYRVRIGPMIQRAEADQVRARLNKEENLDTLVVPHQ